MNIQHTTGIYSYLLHIQMHFVSCKHHFLVVTNTEIIDIHFLIMKIEKQKIMNNFTSK